MLNNISLFLSPLSHLLQLADLGTFLRIFRRFLFFPAIRFFLTVPESAPWEAACRC